MYGFFFFLFLQRFCVWESLATLSPRHPPSLFGGCTPTPPPPFPDPSSGPLVLAPLTSASCLRAKPSPRQPRPDWQGLGAWRGGPGRVALPLICPRRGPASAESLTRSRGPGLGADAGSHGRTRPERKSGHVHRGLVAPPGARGRVGALDCARAAPWPTCWPGAGRCLEVRCGEVSPAASAHTSASGRCAGIGRRRFGTLISGRGLPRLPQQRHFALPAGVCGGGSCATFPGRSGGQGWLAVLGRGREGRGLLSAQSAGVGAGEVAGYP